MSKSDIDVVVDGMSKFNSIIEFIADLLEEQCTRIMTLQVMSEASDENVASNLSNFDGGLSVLGSLAEGIKILMESYVSESATAQELKEFQERIQNIPGDGILARLCRADDISDITDSILITGTDSTKYGPN